MSKLLSIIVPSYNMEKYLPKCLGSVLGVFGGLDVLKFGGLDARGGLVHTSTPPNIHTSNPPNIQLLDVIVVNDGSKDRTSEIGHDFERRYPGIVRVIDKPNGNYGSCINAALPVAEGRFIKILDADDTYDTNAFAQYLEMLAALPEDVDLVVNDFVQVDETGMIRKQTTYRLPTGSCFGRSDIVATEANVAMHGVAHRTALLREIGYAQTEGISYTDTEWFYLPVAYARKIRYLPLPVYRYLVGRTGQTMETATWVKNVGMMDCIFDRMLKQYDEISGDEARVYLEFELTRMFQMVLYLHVLKGSCSEVRSYFAEAKRRVKRFGFLAKSLRHDVLFVRSPFAFYYIEFIVNHPALANVVMSFVNWYNRNRGKVGIGLRRF